MPPSVGCSCVGQALKRRKVLAGFLRGLCFGNSRYFFGCLGLCAYSLSKSHEGQCGLTTASASSPEGAMDFSALRVLYFCINIY